MLLPRSRRLSTPLLDLAECVQVVQGLGFSVSRPQVVKISPSTSSPVVGTESELRPTPILGIMLDRLPPACIVFWCACVRGFHLLPRFHPPTTAFPSFLVEFVKDRANPRVTP